MKVGFWEGPEWEGGGEGGGGWSVEGLPGRGRV